jgi:hypothetical protein
VVLLAVLIVILLVFTYHHTFLITHHSVNKTLNVDNDYSYEIRGIDYFPYTLKDQNQFGGEMPWYYSKEWVSSDLQRRLGEAEWFFSFPYDKNSGEVFISGKLSAKQPDIDFESINVQINGEENSPVGFSFYPDVQSGTLFIIRCELDEGIENMNDLTIMIEGTTVTFESLTEKADKQLKFSPFFNESEYIKEGL